MSDFTNEFDAIFKDVVGKFESKEQPQEEEKPISYDEVAKDLVRFTSRILREWDGKLEMFGIHHLVHYIDHIKKQHERNITHICKCGMEYDIVVEAEQPYVRERRMTYDPLGPGEYYDFMTNRYMESRFCVRCGMSFAVTGKIISMSGQGVNIEYR